MKRLRSDECYTATLHPPVVALVDDIVKDSSNYGGSGCPNLYLVSETVGSE